MTDDQITISPLNAALGAVIGGVDLGKPLAPATVTAIRQALLRHLVVFFHGQSLTPSGLERLAGYFGEPAPYPFLKGLPGHPLITPVIKEAGEEVNFGGLWHADTVYQERPPMGSMLYALEVPPEGGDTLFANLFDAYETLPAELQAVLDVLTGLHSAHNPAIAETRKHRVAEAGSEPEGFKGEAEHPAVRVHPESGRRALFLSPAHTIRFGALSEAESRPMLDSLFAHQVVPERVCRFSWAPGSLAFWDNRCTLHLPLNDYHGQRREMHRVSIAGDVPRGPG